MGAAAPAMSGSKDAIPIAPEQPVRRFVRTGIHEPASPAHSENSETRDRILGVVLAILFLAAEAAGIWGAIHTGGMTGGLIGGATALFALGVTASTMIKFQVLPRAKIFDLFLFLVGGPIVLAICMCNRAKIQEQHNKEPGFRPLFSELISRDS